MRHQVRCVTGRVSFRVLACVSLSLGLSILSGCGGGSNTKNDSDGNPSAKQDGKTNGAASDGGSQVSAPKASVEVRANGSKFLNGVPYDVFFEDPLSVAANQNPAGGGNDGGDTGTPGTGTEVASKDPMKDAPSVAATDWKTIIPKEILESEVKRIRNRLTANLKTIGSYKQSYLSMQPHIATLAAMGGIAAEHSDAPSWKANSKSVRDLAGAMLSEKLNNTAPAYKQVNEPFMQIIDIFDGSPPADLPEVAAETTFSDKADMGHLMKRLKVASEWLKINAGSEETFKSNADEIKHESRIIAALSKVIATEGYGYHDDEDFLSHSVPMLDSAVKMANAAESGDFETYDAGLTRIYKSCQDCHTLYR